MRRLPVEISVVRNRSRVESFTSIQPLMLENKKPFTRKFPLPQATPLSGACEWSATMRGTPLREHDQTERRNTVFITEGQ